MPNGGTWLSVDLTSSEIAATVSHHGARIPVMFDGRPAIPSGVVVDPAGQLHVGVPAVTALPPDHHFIADPLQLAGDTTAGQRIDAVEPLAAVLRHVGHHASYQVGGPVTALTATIPASWGPRRRDHLTAAANRAGLPAPAMVTAPAALAAHAATRGFTAPAGSCLLICQADRHPITLTVLQTSPAGYRELATRPIRPAHDLDDILTQRIVDAAFPARDRLPGQESRSVQEGDMRGLRESVRQARQLLTGQDRAPVLLPAPHQPAVITRDDVTTAALPVLETLGDGVRDILDAADIDHQHLGGVIVHQGDLVPGLPERLACATGLTPVTVAGGSHALADGALALTAAPQHAPTAAHTQLPRVRLRVRDLTTAVALSACSLALLLQTVLTADVVSIDYRIVGVRLPLPQLGAAGALAILTAFAVAHLAPTTWLAGTPTTATPVPATGSLIRRGYLTAAVGGTVAAALYGLATGAAVDFDYGPYLTWTLRAALPLTLCAAVIAAAAPRIPADALPAWLERTRPAVVHAAIAAVGVYLMRAALTLTPPVDLTGMPGLAGSVGAALVGIATALTASRNRAIRVITAPGLGIGYAIVFTSDTSSAIIIGYIAAVTWWAVALTAHTLRLAFPGTGSAVRRFLDVRDA